VRRPVLWVQDVEGHQLVLTPSWYRGGDVVAAAVAFAVAASSSIREVPSASTVARFRDDARLPNRWVAELSGRLTERNRRGGAHALLPSPPPAPATSELRRARLRRLLLPQVAIMAVVLVLILVPLLTGIGPRAVHRWYCARKRSLWTTTTQVRSTPTWSPDRVMLPGLDIASQTPVKHALRWRADRPEAITSRIGLGTGRCGLRRCHVLRAPAGARTCRGLAVQDRGCHTSFLG
jgi:hypothetical protein